VLRIDPFGDRSRLVGWVVAGALLVAVLVAGGAFLADPAASTPDPVAYDDTVELGLSTETDAEMGSDATVPRVQVFYSQFQYVVGYNGVEAFVGTLADDRTERQLGFPLTVYVQTFDDAEPYATDDGRFAASERPSWSPATEAAYVVDGDVESPAGETVVPFADPEVAERFAASHDGRVVEWDALRDRSFDIDTADAVRSVAPERWTAADDRIRTSRDRIDRPESVVVGEDEPTIEAAVDAAEPNTSVRIPPDEYEETVVIDEPITIVGENASIRGNGTGSVIEVRSPDVGIVGLSISGTGNETRDPDASGGPPDDGDEWDTNVQLGYGHGDAGIRAVNAPGLFVEDVTIDTDASGVLLRDGSDATLTGLHVRGADDWRDGFMGVVGMESRVTVTDSRFEDGRDGVYLHRADGSVVRNSTFIGTRYGAHLMYTADSLIADNVARDQLYGGITVMTRRAGTRSWVTTFGTPLPGSRRRACGRTSATTRSRTTGWGSPRVRAARSTSTTSFSTTRRGLGRRRSSRRAASPATTSSATTTTPVPEPDRSGSGPTATEGTTGREPTPGSATATERTNRPRRSTPRFTATRRRRRWPSRRRHACSTG